MRAAALLSRRRVVMVLSGEGATAAVQPSNMARNGGATENFPLLLSARGTLNGDASTTPRRRGGRRCKLDPALKVPPRFKGLIVKKDSTL